jgi:hypothetical protein
MVADDVARYLSERQQLVARIKKLATAIALHDEQQTRVRLERTPEVREQQAAAMARQTLETMRRRLEQDLERLDGQG